MTRQRTQDACNKAAIASLRPFRMVPLPVSADSLFAECRAHLDSLTPERRAELEGGWK